MKQIIVLPKSKLSGYISECRNPNIMVVEISSDSRDEVTRPSANCRQYVFQDIDEDTKVTKLNGQTRVYKAISPQQAKDIIEFFMRFATTCDTFICSCDAGISRSGAVADMFYRILRYHFRFKEVEIINEEHIFPNIRVSIELNRAFKTYVLVQDFPDIS